MKLITQDGREIFDFGNDQLGGAVIWKLGFLAKFQAGLDSTVSSNPLVNQFMLAAAEAQARTYKTVHGGGSDAVPERRERPDMSDHQINTSTELNQARRLFMSKLPNWRWWELADEKKLALVETAIFPFNFSDQQKRDWIDDMDNFVRRFRDPDKPDDKEPVT